jgi:hypothetical protein
MSFESNVLGLWYLRYRCIIKKTFFWYQDFWPCDLDLNKFLPLSRVIYFPVSFVVYWQLLFFGLPGVGIHNVISKNYHMSDITLISRKICDKNFYELCSDNFQGDHYDIKMLLMIYYSCSVKKGIKMGEFSFLHVYTDYQFCNVSKEPSH